MAEIWKDIKGYEGLYQVSNLGRVRSIDKIKKGRYSTYLKTGKILNCNFKNNRYGKVTLYKNGMSEEKRIHRLVAETFIPNPENKPQVNHIDNNSKNNCVSNLEWVTVQENVIHAHKIGASKPPMINKKHSAISREKMRNKKLGNIPSNALLTIEEVKNIIKRKLKKEKRNKVYSDYKDKIKLISFEGIWYGRSYKNIWREFL